MKSNLRYEAKLAAAAALIGATVLINPAAAQNAAPQNDAWTFTLSPMSGFLVLAVK